MSSQILHGIGDDDGPKLSFVSTPRKTMEDILRRTELNSWIKGHLGQDEDWWYLVEDDEGASHIEHVWSHIGKRGPNVGKTSIPIHDFRRGDYDPTAQARLEEILDAGEANGARQID